MSISQHYRHHWRCIVGQSHFLYAILCILSLSACSDSVPAIRALQSDSVILAFGDSLTHGTGTQRDNAYPAQLSQLLAGRTVINAGIPGEVSEQGRARLPALLAEHQPQLVILCHGGNDILRKMDRNQLRTNLQAMITTIQQQGADVVLLGVPQPSLINLSVPDLYPQLAEEFDIPYQGDVLSNVLGDEDLKSDTVHPNAAGYRQMAEALAELITQAQEAG